MSAFADMVKRRDYVRHHRPIPQMLEMFHRYQCRFCHSWIYYDEAIGSWWHNSEKNKPKFWNGFKWVLEEHKNPYGMSEEEWQKHLETYR